MKALIVANWKMNPPTYKEARKLFDASKKALEKTSGVQLVIAPPALYLHELGAGSRGKRIAFAAQNAHFEAGGAHTGEVSMVQVKDAGASYVLIGHAERRAMGETDDDVRKKVAAAFAHTLTPIVCVGESSRGTSGEFFDFVGAQLRTGLADVPQKKISRVIIAYEPLWAIGAIHAMEPRQMHEMSIFIKKTAVDLHGAEAMGMKILYGGSIEAENAPMMLVEGGVSGLLVGRASEDIPHMTALMAAIGK